MTQRRVEADDYQDETSLEGEDEVESRDNELRIFDVNRLAFLNDILGVRSRTSGNLSILNEASEALMSVPPPSRDQKDPDIGILN